MALIMCPECGGQVSSTAKQCVHCGCKYSVCPECGRIYKGDIAKCSDCGFQISEKRKELFGTGNSGSVKTESDYGADIINIWERRSATDKIIMKTVKYTGITLTILFIIFILIALFIIEFWDTKTIDSLLKADKIIDKAHGLIIAACVVGALVPIVNETKMIYSQIMCGNWLRKNELDAAPYVKKAYGQIDMEVLPIEWDYDNLSSAAYLAVVPHDRNILITKFVLMTILSVAISIAAGVFLTQNADELIRNKLYDNAFTFKYEALIAIAVLAGLYYLINIICNKIFEKRKNLWIQSL